MAVLNWFVLRMRGTDRNYVNTEYSLLLVRPWNWYATNSQHGLVAYFLFNVLFGGRYYFSAWHIWHETTSKRQPLFLRYNYHQFVISWICLEYSKYSRLSLSRIPRDSLKHFEISVPRHIRVERVRKKINWTTTFNKWICNLTPKVRYIYIYI